MIWHDDGQARFYLGDVRECLGELADGSAHCVVTSPPYWGLRDYGVAGQLGLESTPECYVENMVAVFREVKRVLRDDGTLWLNVGDSYAANRGYQVPDSKHVDVGNARGMKAASFACKPKDLVGIPWMLAFALRADGWYLRSDIIWSKPNPMPESVTDRPTKAHEYVFLLSKRERYYYDAEAIREANEGGLNWGAQIAVKKAAIAQGQNHGPNSIHVGGDAERERLLRTNGRNKRSVWHIPTAPFPEAHFATFPPALVEPCILAGSRPGDVVIDPFLGSGTTAMVAKRLGRRAVGIDLNPEYLDMARRRCAQMGLIA